MLVLGAASAIRMRQLSCVYSGVRERWQLAGVLAGRYEKRSIKAFVMLCCHGKSCQSIAMKA